MRILALLLLLAALSYAFTVVNVCGAPQDYVDRAKKYLQQAYEMYCEDIKCSSLCPDFYVELRDIEYGGLTYTRISGGMTCAYRIVLDCDMADYQLLHMAFHEMAHALQAAYPDVVRERGYGWWSEAHAEGIAIYYLTERVWETGRWQHFGWIRYFWSEKLYERDPQKCEAPDLCSYKYGAFFAWLAWRYGARNSTETYALPLSKMMVTYYNFLLSPWNWGRDPTYYDYSECVEKQMVPNTATYCVYGTAQQKVYIFASNTLINASVRDNVIYLALVAPGRVVTDPSVTVSNCPPATATTTVTTTVTHTTTLVQRETVTTTTTVSVTHRETETVTIPVTTTVTETATMTATIPVTTTQRETVIETVIKEVIKEDVPKAVVALLLIIALIVGCSVCGYLRRVRDLNWQRL